MLTKDRYEMERVLLILMLLIGSAPCWALLQQSETAMVNGRVMGLPSENLANFEVMLVSDGASCAVLQSHTMGDGSFRFSFVHAGEYRAAVIGLPAAYGIKTMTDGGAVDLLFNPIRVVATAPTNILIEIARIEEIRSSRPSVVQVGDGLRQSQCAIHRVKAVYPPQAKTARITGNVILSIGLDKNGYVEDVTLVQGHPLLIQSAMDAVRQWRLVPFVLSGATIQVKTTVIDARGFVTPNGMFLLYQVEHITACERRLGRSLTSPFYRPHVRRKQNRKRPMLIRNVTEFLMIIGSPRRRYSMGCITNVAWRGLPHEVQCVKCARSL